MRSRVLLLLVHVPPRGMARAFRSALRLLEAPALMRSRPDVVDERRSARGWLMRSCVLPLLLVYAPPREMAHAFVVLWYCHVPEDIRASTDRTPDGAGSNSVCHWLEGNSNAFWELLDSRR